MLFFIKLMCEEDVYRFNENNKNFEISIVEFKNRFFFLDFFIVLVLLFL